MTPNKKSTLSICAYDTAQFYDLMPTLPYCELYDKLLLFKGIGRVACYRFYTFISFDPHKRMGDNSFPEQITVLVTGFGPFAMHSVNASWIAVAELSKTGLGKEAANVNLVTKEIQVEYQTVSELVPKLWETYKPQLMVHVGVSGITKQLTLEQQAFNDGYNKGDICGCTPDGECCIDGADECIVSGIDMASVCDFVNKSQCSVKAVVSHDPGRYLCDFIYFTSLSVDKYRTAFIHVPPLDKPYTAEQLAEGIRQSIVAMLIQLKLL